MNLATKNKLILMAGYLIFVLITGAWVEFEVRATIINVMEDTSELIAKEIKSALYEPLTDYLQKKRTLSEKELRDILISATEKSDSLVVIDLVKNNGKVTSSSDRARIANTVPIPRHLFDKDYDPKLTSEFKSLTDVGTHTLWAPIHHDGTNLGFLRIVLRGLGLAKIFNRIYTTLLISAFIGLIVILALNMLLHFELNRITSGLTRLFESAMRGEEVDADVFKRDEFTQVRHVASRIGNEIKKTRDKISLVNLELNAIANHLKMGVVLVDRDNHFDFINDRAKMLITPHDRIESYPERLDALMEVLKPEIDSLQHSRKLTRSLSFEIGEKTNLKRLNVELYRLHGKEWHGCVILLNDQSFIDALNEDLRSAARLRALSSLLLGAIHDIKAPLNAVMMNIELLSDSVQEGESRAGETNAPADSALSYINIIRSELKRLNQLISSLYSQTLGDTQQNEKTVAELGTIVEDLCLLLKPQATSQRVRLNYVKPGAPIHFFGYPGQIKQAILNIVLNALEIMPDGGEVTLDISVVDDVSQLIICDTGPGIPAALEKHIFDMHFTTKNTGTGIGLYVSKQILVNHGGDLTLLAKNGKGACLCLTLPTVPPSA